MATKSFCRRYFLCSTTASFLPAGLVNHPALPSCSHTSVTTTSVDVQRFCFRPLLEKDFELAQIATPGYDHVDFAGYYNDSADEPKKLPGNLQCTGAHIGINPIWGDELQQPIDFHQEPEISTLIVAATSEERRASRNIMPQTARECAIAQETPRKHRTHTGYHNYACSFNPWIRKQSGTLWPIIPQTTWLYNWIPATLPMSLKWPKDIPNVYTPCMSGHTRQVQKNDVHLLSVIKSYPGRKVLISVNPLEVWMIGCRIVTGNHTPLEALTINRKHVRSFGQ